MLRPIRSRTLRDQRTYTHYEQLFNSRQLYCLCKILREIKKARDKRTREYLLLAFSDCLAHNNMLVSYAFGYKKATPLFAIHGYQIPQRSVEGNVWGNPHFGRGSFSRCIRKLISGKDYALKPFEYDYTSGEPKRVLVGRPVSTYVVTDRRGWKHSTRSKAWLLWQSSTSLSAIPNRSVDLVLTDPPFYNNLPYSELSDFYYQWLRPFLGGKMKMAPVSQSLFVKRRSSSEHSKYCAGLSAAFKECARVLKMRGMMAFTFHHRDPAAWQALANALIEAGFVITALSPVRAEGVSGFHTYDGTPKWDAIVCCRKGWGRSRRAKKMSSEAEIVAIKKEEREWTRRFRKRRIPWSEADRASFAYATAMHIAVNRKLNTAALNELLSNVARLYPQKGIAVSIPASAT